MERTAACAFFCHSSSSLLRPSTRRGPRRSVSKEICRGGVKQTAFTLAQKKPSPSDSKMIPNAKYLGSIISSVIQNPTSSYFLAEQTTALGLGGRKQEVCCCHGVTQQLWLQAKTSRKLWSLYYG